MCYLCGMISGGVPKNFTQDVVVATEILGKEQPIHKIAVQITVAGDRVAQGFIASCYRETSPD